MLTDTLVFAFWAESGGKSIDGPSRVQRIRAHAKELMKC